MGRAPDGRNPAKWYRLARGQPATQPGEGGGQAGDRPSLPLGSRRRGDGGEFDWLVSTYDVRQRSLHSFKLSTHRCSLYFQLGIFITLRPASQCGRPTWNSNWLYSSPVVPLLRRPTLARSDLFQPNGRIAWSKFIPRCRRHRRRRCHSQT